VRIWCSGRRSTGPRCSRNRRFLHRAEGRAVCGSPKVAPHRLERVHHREETGTGKELIARAVHKRIAAVGTRLRQCELCRTGA